MNKESLKQLIKEIVREEVQNSLPTMLPKIMAEIFSSKAESSSALVKTNKTVSKSVTAIQTPSGSQPMKVFTQNEKLNKALNETVVSIPRDGSVVSPGIGQSESIIDRVDNVPAPVAQALTKNYSELMKAIDNKRKGGVISSNKIGML